jgi:flavin-binding protein dodecin
MSFRMGFSPPDLGAPCLGAGGNRRAAGRWVDGTPAVSGRLRQINAQGGVPADPFRSQDRRGESDMSMLKVLEVLAESDKSWEDAAQNALKEANKTVRGVKSIYIKEMEATVVDGKIGKYRINAKISFLLEGS